ncbi:unnamed protein product [Soboliphyme baturini]|uniref:DUF1794 domain-containing protein n=1 Tax=Soboliphyme baturini TaxID=241478 RepID=A0A183J225_9BILA|nr:unnamed protein product [Soboliphyme baturini]
MNTVRGQSARAWSHTTKDHLHNECGYMTVDQHGTVTFMTAGNNGFSTYEEGTVVNKKLSLRLKQIGRISFTRDLPVEDLERNFTLVNPKRLEQSQRMRTATHPKVGLLDHVIVVYEKQK